MTAARVILPASEPDAAAARRAPEHVRRAEHLTGRRAAVVHGSNLAVAAEPVARNVVVDFRDREAPEPALVAGVRAIFHD